MREETLHKTKIAIEECCLIMYFAAKEISQNDAIEVMEHTIANIRESERAVKDGIKKSDTLGRK